MKIFFLNNDGGGFADQIEVVEGTTLGELFEQRMPGSDPHNYLIRVNRQPAVADEPLTEGSRVSVTPTKIQGAAAWRRGRLGRCQDRFNSPWCVRRR